MGEKQPAAAGERPFFVVKKRGRYEVMSEPEIMQDESVTLASEPYNTHAEAEAALRRGIANGSYKPVRLP
jgi:hypothetical protein